jgi:hypothetical protein
MSIGPLRTRGADRSDIEDFLLEVLRNPFLRSFLDGRLITGAVLDGSGNVQGFNHGLGRSYVGALVVGQTSTSRRFSVLTPATATSSGIDPTQQVAVAPSGSGTGTLNIYVW